MPRRALFPAAAFMAAMATVFHPAFGEYEDPRQLSVEAAPGKVLAIYTLDQLKSEFSLQSLETQTPWTKDGEKIGFRGPLVKDVLARHGLTGQSAVQFIAYDNFVSEIRMEEINAFSPILAIERKCSADDRKQGTCAANQEYRRLNTKDSGPIFIVWPFEQLPAAYIPARNSIWVWFVVAVRPVP
jgi:hypothetical protein